MLTKEANYTPCMIILHWASVFFLNILTLQFYLDYVEWWPCCCNFWLSCCMIWLLLSFVVFCLLSVFAERGSRSNLAPFASRWPPQTPIAMGLHYIASIFSAIRKRFPNVLKLVSKLSNILHVSFGGEMFHEEFY